MKPFKSFLAPKMDEFLAYRESLGYSLKTLRYHLLILDRYVRDNSADRHSLQPAFFLEMRTNLKLEANSVNANLSAARTFFQFLVRHGYYQKNPLQDIPHLKRNTVVPFIFTPKQTDQLLEAMCKRFHKTKGHFLTDLAVYMALLFLARCGMRISEPLKLQRNHYRSDDRTIYIERTKFLKDRLIPLPQMVATQLENYLSVRTSLMRNESEPLSSGSRKPTPFIRFSSAPLVSYQFKRYWPCATPAGYRQCELPPAHTP